MFRRLVAVGLLFAAVVFAPVALAQPAAQSPVPAHDVSRPCEYCHQMASGTSHPVGVRPSMSIPEDLPLGEGGRVVCTTCHDVQGAPTGGRAGSPRLRRQAYDGSLCAACHGGKRTEDGLLSHALMIGSAHGGGQAGASGRPGGVAIGLDSRSLQCMGCHDGSIAESDNMRIANPSVFGQPGSGEGPSLGQTHPVGVDYASAALARREFESSASLRRGAVRLVEGKVGCTSCHSPYSKNARLLVVSNAGSALCMRCHHL